MKACALQFERTLFGLGIPKITLINGLEAVLRETAAANNAVEFIALDTADAASVKNAADEMRVCFPRLNVVVSNAGMQRS